MSNLVVFLVAFPLAVGALLLAIRNGKLRNIVVAAAGIVVAAASIVTAATFGNGDAIFFGLPNGITLGQSLLAAEIAIAALIVVISIANRRILAPAMVLAQVAIAVYLEISGKMPKSTRRGSSGSIASR